jgi:polyhydroxyalkanoate synthesis regulator phasin
MNLKKALPIAGTASVLGLLLGATVFGPGLATAQETTTTVDDSGTDQSDRWLEILQPLVDDGTLTSDQAQAVAEHLASTLPGRRGRFIGRGPGLAAFVAAAEIIGIEPSELRAALADGSTLAEVAEANGVSEEALIEGLVGVLEEKLDQLVEAGKISADHADEILEKAPERIEKLVNSEVHVRRGFWLRPGQDDQGSDA